MEVLHPIFARGIVRDEAPGPITIGGARSLKSVRKKMIEHGD